MNRGRLTRSSAHASLIFATLLLFAQACTNSRGSAERTILLQLARPVVDLAVANTPADDLPVSDAVVRTIAGDVLKPDGQGQVKLIWPNNQLLTLAVIEPDGRKHVFLDLPATSTTVWLAPLQVTDTRSIGGTAITTVIVTSAWTPSGIGERSEAWVARQPLGNQTISPALTAIEDRYLRAGFETGDTGNRCVCEGGTTNDCSDGTIRCADDDELSSRVSAATIFTLPGPNRIGFVERIVDYEQEVFRESGWIFLADRFDPGFSGPVTVVAEPTILPNDELCDGDGRIRLHFAGLGRSFVLPSSPGIRIWLGLVGPDHFRLPILTGDAFRGVDVQDTGSGQAISFGYPYDLTGLISNYRYELATRATKSISTGSANGTISISDATSIDAAAALCRATLQFPEPVFVLLSPSEPVSMPSLLEWQTSVTGLTRLQLNETEPIDIWLGAERHQLDLSRELTALEIQPQSISTATWTVWTELPPGPPPRTLLTSGMSGRRVDVELRFGAPVTTAAADAQ